MWGLDDFVWWVVLGTRNTLRQPTLSTGWHWIVIRQFPTSFPRPLTRPWHRCVPYVGRWCCLPDDSLATLTPGGASNSQTSPKWLLPPTSLNALGRNIGEKVMTPNAVCLAKVIHAIYVNITGNVINVLPISFATEYYHVVTIFMHRSVEGIHICR